MIKPQFREFIIPLATLHFRMRFWISHETNLRPLEISPAMLNLRKKIDELPADSIGHVRDVEIIVQAHFMPENRVTAYEILTEKNAGVVGYVEWP